MKLAHIKSLILFVLSLMVILAPVYHGLAVSEQVRLDRALVEAIKKNDVGETQALLDQGADANARHEDSEDGSLLHGMTTGWFHQPKPATLPTPLFYATGWRDGSASDFYTFPGDPAIVKSLLDKGADVNVRDVQGDTPLISAARNKQGDAMKLLLDLKADSAAVDANGQTAWSICCSQDFAKGVVVLLNHGVKVNQRDVTGATALIWCAQQGHGQAARVLIQSHADVNVRDNRGYTALGYAMRHRHKSIEQMLRSVGAHQ